MDFRFAFEVGATLCLQISVVIALTAALQRWIGDARFGCRLWTICFLSIIALLAVGVLLPHRRLFGGAVDFQRETVLAIVMWQGRLTIALAAVWGAGVLVFLGRRLVRCLQLLRFLKDRCTPVDSPGLLKRLECSSNLPDGLKVLTSPEIQGPFCWQLHRPLIVLPTFLLEEDDTTLRHVMLHELEHLRTRHPMQHFLQGICSMVFWFHPAIRLAGRNAELTREFLCDEVAAKTAGKFGPYLRTLAIVAEHCGRSACTAVPQGTLAFGNQKSALVRRCDRLVALAHNRVPSRQWRSMTAIVVLLLSVVVVQQVWLPTNVMASSRSHWSPWPTWTANVLHQCNIQVRDFELFEERVQLHELIKAND
ncbi:Methicillin resistance mecR1 protein [Roseimaritima multifibrata]|uniref:Methicillin resistance mecR1 protein n=1 Tax=Roseimaritima multifibrata TaxID=1930274 RepID=A0A517M9C4_9BACT|nr:M56 family metallopeptidase [Roseimaritima multifibrata]QDS91496.1 Methicillin resistance mecR1 protein [Roseimaritima multifibrata]